MDAQSVKNTDTAALKGYDAGKKVSGIERHIAADTQRFPHAVDVTTAEVTDRKGALQALKPCKPNLGRVQSVLCDSGYTGAPFAQGVREALGEQVTVQIAKRSELHKFAVIPKRWVVERSFAWLEKRKTGGCGRTVSGCSIPACSLCISLSWRYCSEDFEHVLRPPTQVARSQATTQLVANVRLN